MSKIHTFREICYENKRKPHLCYVYTTSDMKTRINKSVYSQRKIEWFANGRCYTIGNRSSVNDYVTLRFVDDRAVAYLSEFFQDVLDPNNHRMSKFSNCTKRFCIFRFLN